MEVFKELRAEKEPDRFEYAKQELAKLGIGIVAETDTSLQFNFKGETIVLFSYTGWHTGKSIKDGRGIKHLLKQLK